MRILDENKMCFILCTNDQTQLDECLLYIDLLEIPTGFQIDVITVNDAESMAKGYNEAMLASDAKYKVYLHQDVFIIEKHFIEKVIKIFQKDNTIGMIGMIGVERLPKDGVMWHGKRCGDLYRLDESERGIEKIEKGYREVEAIDGFLMITSQDIAWREDIFDEWDFYDVSQCLEFQRAGYKVVVPAQNPAWAIHDCGPQKLWNYEKQRKKLLEEYKDVFIKKKELRILFLNSNKITLFGLPMGLEDLGHDVYVPDYEVTLECYDARDVVCVGNMLEEGNYDLVVTYNFSQGVSQACENAGVRYLAWVYDTPLLQVYTKEAKNECNYICVFDKKQKERLEEFGIKNVYYYPLAAEVDAFGSTGISKSDEKKYSAEIAFVGSLYQLGEYEQVFANAPEIIKKDAEHIVHSTDCIWDGVTTIFGKAKKETVEYMTKQQADSFWNTYQIDKGYCMEGLTIGVKASELERVKILNALAKKHKVVLYTGSEHTEVLQGVDVHPRVDYMQAMPKIFHLSKINLNITIRRIEAGISQRVWDVLSVGGFLLTNYQPELEEYFEIGKDLEVYHSLDELIRKVDYYLKHEEQRVRIAMNGYKKVRDHHKYTNRLTQILNEVFDYHEILV